MELDFILSPKEKSSPSSVDEVVKSFYINQRDQRRGWKNPVKIFLEW